MEDEYDNFYDLFEKFRSNISKLQHRIFENYENHAERVRLQSLFDELSNLDVKLRLAFGIADIRLNPNFVDEKQDDLKLCHLFYYKIADLWFAYESYFIFYSKVLQPLQSKINWLDAVTHSDYSDQPQIIHALNLANQNFSKIYNETEHRVAFIDYLNYCLTHAKNSQVNRLHTVINKIQDQNFSLSHTDILTVIYSVRNNFVHNGETTVVPDSFGFQNKARLLLTLHPYLSIILLKSVNFTFEKISALSR